MCTIAQIEARVNKKALADFIREEMRLRKMNLTQFAQYVGVAHPTVGRVLNPKSKTVPSLDFLDKLAKATHTDLCTLVSLLYPDSARTSPTARLIAQRIGRLSEADQRVVDRFLLTLLLQADDEGDEGRELGGGEGVN